MILTIKTLSTPIEATRFLQSKVCGFHDSNQAKFYTLPTRTTRLGNRQLLKETPASSQAFPMATISHGSGASLTPEQLAMDLARTGIPIDRNKSAVAPDQSSIFHVAEMALRRKLPPDAVTWVPNLDIVTSFENFKGLQASLQVKDRNKANFSLELYHTSTPEVAQALFHHKLSLDGQPKFWRRPPELKFGQLLLVKEAIQQIIMWCHNDILIVINSKLEATSGTQAVLYNFTNAMDAYLWGS
ncbi:hypothetical protein B0T26DRAFT_140866 [Lasiosphaeria miniovina]|uniref:Uncharacterized protein n=1 Tax=Lasiosphaeria miniovina TaxID=1954250 RepID=A0AA40E586_9PEZI|nr:uncharacterized protein B0T26DRAFT_140866 [Lasiosphaeria miniovina]KAK0727610.1 hypothetical protein B0T26DRAFT_140866 [Lasiosphaeria miniovina]